MHSLIFPTTVVDNFLDQPEKFVDLANSLEYKKDPNGKWPGVRSEELSKLYPEMVSRILLKIMSLYYNFNSSVDFVEWNVDAFFQKVSSDYDSGWVHNDYDSQLTSIIYFCHSGFGTSICKPKNIANFLQVKNTKEKNASYQNPNEIKKYSSYRQDNNDLFVNSISIDSAYNRLLVFEADNFHCVDNFKNDTAEERLTMVIFIKNLKSNKFPIQRSKGL